MFTIPDLTLLSAFIAGLIGSVHCTSMCSGIVGILTVNLPNNARQSWLQLAPYLLTYNLGRISSYVVAGVLVGFLGEQFIQWLPFENPRSIAMWVSGLFMIVLGLYIGAWWQVLLLFEKAGGYLWRRIEPLGRHFLPVKHPMQALGLGLVWGWLPCGLVYAILPFALAANNAWHGGMLMLAFGLGTLPMLLTMGATAHWLTNFAHHLIVRRIAGAIAIVFGLMILFVPHHS